LSFDVEYSAWCLLGWVFVSDGSSGVVVRSAQKFSDLIIFYFYNKSIKLYIVII
jgi:hypothetical protein